MFRRSNVNNGWDELSKVGVRESRNTTVVDTTLVNNRIGVDALQVGEKKATLVELVLPTRRTENGSRTTTRVLLNGFQARSLFEALKTFYNQ